MIYEVLKQNPECEFDGVMTETEMQRAYERFYFQFIHAVDCHDNDIHFGKTPYHITTTFSQRIARLNNNSLYTFDESS